MSEKPQFDATLGGTQSLPYNFPLGNFVAARSQEIQVMKTAVSTQQQQTKLAFQSLPRHMRRRAMSHDVRRLPRRIRQIHLNQMKKSGLATTTTTTKENNEQQQRRRRPPSRKYRRRPWNLIEEYTKRSTAKYKWLQTHIWHAKRFHMIQRWDYRLPHRPCDKAFRACYRAVIKHCLLQDISYIRCIELMGNCGREEIIEQLKKITKMNSGIKTTIGAKSFINGQREGELTLFHHEDNKAIGSINFQWKPPPSTTNSSSGSDVVVSVESSSSSTWSLWLWCHAAFYKSVLEYLKYYFKSNTAVVVNEIDELCRFRLTGPLSTPILQDTFNLLKCEDITTTTTDNNHCPSSSSWLIEHMNNNLSSINNQIDFWKSLKNITSPSEISPHTILSLIVEDPRYNLPKRKRTTISPNDSDANQEIPMIYDCNNKNISSSPLWDENLREIVNESKISDAQLAELRSKLLIPGSNLPGKGAFVPVILIQRPGTRREYYGFGSGWDLIVPSKWAKSFWISLMYRNGIRAGGLRETDSIHYEMGKSFYLEPDTEAGRLEEERITKESREIFFKRPPNKRINFNKFNIVSPFTWNWKLLINDWHNHDNDGDFAVIRDKNILMEIQGFLDGRRKILGDYINSKSLVPVRIISCKKGAIKPFGIICLPNDDDDHKRKIEPIEPMSSRIDCRNQETRKLMRKQHQALLKKMRKRRIIERQKNKTVPNKLKIEHQTVLSEYTKKMRQLWLPDATTIRKSSARDIIGFIRSSGGFSLTKGQNVAVGYIVVGSLISLIDRKVNKHRILIRNTNTRQYRWAMMDVIVE